MKSECIERATVKSSAIHFFDEHSSLWAGRYSDPGARNSLRDRHSSILAMIDEWNPSRDWRFVDVGCGAGFLTFDLARRGLQGVGIDGAGSMIDACKSGAAELGIRNWNYTQTDVEETPFPDHSFDAAVCCGVIEYLPDDGDLFREVKRVLRPGGRFLLCVTNRYGYAQSLSPLLQAMKRIPGVLPAASAIRGALTGRSQMMNLEFQPRRHSPSQIRRSLAAHGFQFENDRFCVYSLLPGPLSMFIPGLENRCYPYLSKLGQTRLRQFGSFYLISSRV